jgi:hypothetical protein
VGDLYTRSRGRATSVVGAFYGNLSRGSLTVMVKEFQNHIEAVEKDMLALLSGTQGKLKHKGNRGSDAEDHFRTSLARCLPISLGFGHGEVIDSMGNRSKQTDAVILSRDHPGTFAPELPNLF